MHGLDLKGTAMVERLFPARTAATATRVLTLAPHQVLRIERPDRLRLRLRRGGLWITLDNRHEDIVLAAGDDFAFCAGLPAVISAFGEGAEFEARRLPAPDGALSRLASAIAQYVRALTGGRRAGPALGAR
jgi:hypothetical protein